jgi:putative ABC transport system ATP-binding protein
MDTVVGLQDRLTHLPSELSGGEQQRVYAHLCALHAAHALIVDSTIARALSNDPQVLLLDEPTGDLDTKNTIEVMDLLMDINQKQQTTCIMVTHNPDLECYADRIIYLEDGIFKRQVVNRKPMRMKYEQYVAYLNSQESGHEVK